MSGYVNPVFRPDFTGDVAPPVNRLAPGFSAIWPPSNPVGTETTQGMQSATPVDQIAFMRPDGTPVMASDMAAAHQQVQTAMQVAPTMVLGMMGTTNPTGIRAFHGSPYDFERFDTSKIGTGEGAQAYGHGLYMAENEGVAQQYRDVLASRSETNTPEGVAKFWANMQGGHEGGIAHLESVLGQIDKYPNSYAPGEADKINSAIQYLKSGGDLKPASGKMYEVNIDSDPEKFLHWDKPISEQSPDVRQALQQAGYNLPDWGGRTGGDLLKATGDQAAAAQFLQGAGIPGIRYLDQGSRGAGEGTHNYVVFDANTIDILRKYGLAGLGIGLGSAAGTQQQSQ